MFTALAMIRDAIRLVHPKDAKEGEIILWCTRRWNRAGLHTRFTPYDEMAGR